MNGRFVIFLDKNKSHGRDIEQMISINMMKRGELK